jgi:hypothetical protein
MDKPDVMAVGRAAWDEIVRVAQSSQGTTALDAHPFAVLLGCVSVESFKEIKAKLATLSVDA